MLNLATSITHDSQINKMNCNASNAPSHNLWLPFQKMIYCQYQVMKIQLYCTIRLVKQMFSVKLLLFSFPISLKKVFWLLKSTV